MNLYAESSAILSWLLAEEDGENVRNALASAELVIASELTLIECHRVLHRAIVTNELSDHEAAHRRTLLGRASQHWILFRLESEVSQRCMEPFPEEPIRTLDAIHLATALLVRGLLPELTVLALDRRVRASALELGFALVPVAPES